MKKQVLNVFKSFSEEAKKKSQQRRHDNLICVRSKRNKNKERQSDK